MQFVTLNLSCALMFRKLRQLGPVDVVVEKEAVCWRGTFEQHKILNGSLSDRRVTCWGLYQFTVSLGRGILPTFAPQKDKMKKKPRHPMCCLSQPISQVLSVRLCEAVKQQRWWLVCRAEMPPLQ